MKQILIVIFILNTSISFAQHKYVIKVKGNIEGKEVSGMPNLAGRNYANDSVAVIEGSLKLWDYYRTGNIVKVVSTLPTSTGFYYVVDNSDGTSANQSVRIDGWNGNFNVTVDWGDGAIDYFNNASDYTMTHTYTTNAVLNPTFIVNDLTLPNEIYINSGIKVIDIKNVSLFTQLALLLSDGTYLKNIDNIDYPSSLLTLYIESNDIIAFNPVNSLPNTLTNLYLDWNHLTSFSPSVGLPPTIKVVDIQGNNLNSTEVNNTLVWLDGLSFNPGPKNLYIKQQGSAPPSGAGITAITSLNSKGWSIVHD